MILELLLPFSVLFSLFIIQTCLQLIRNLNSKKQLPNHIRYFKSSEKKLKQEYDAGISKAPKQSKYGKKDQKQLQFSKIKKYLPPQITPFGDQSISQPQQPQTNVQFTHEIPQETNIAQTPISPGNAPRFSQLLTKIQQEAEKIHDETKKTDKEEKKKEKEEREKRKQEEKEALRKKQEEEAAAAAAQNQKKPGLGTGGLGKGLGSSLSKTKLSLSKSPSIDKTSSTSSTTTENKEETKEAEK